MIFIKNIWKVAVQQTNETNYSINDIKAMKEKRNDSKSKQKKNAT